MSDDVRSIFKENLQMYMTEQNKTQADMARYFGISTATASDWYNGKKIPRSDKLQSIATWLGIELQDLLTDPEQHKDMPGYYRDPKTAKMAQKIFENSDLRALFDASEDASPEDLRMAAELLKRLKGTNIDG